MTTRFALTSDLHRGYSKRTWRVHEDFFSKLAAESFDVLLLAGDLGTTRMDHFKGLLRAIKEAVPDRPILAVRGNHDLWDKKKRYYFAGGAFRDLRLLLKYQDQLFDRFGVYHLERGPFFVGNVVVVGWDGWYHTDPPTNDSLFLPDFIGDLPVNRFLARRADEAFGRVLEQLDAHKDKRRVGMTHMPCFRHKHLEENLCANPRYMDFLRGRCDVLCVGHSHLHLDEKIEGIQVYQSGSNYDRPRYILFDA